MWFVGSCHHILCVAPDHLLAMNFHGSSWGYHVTSVVYNCPWRVAVQRTRGGGSVVAVPLSVLDNQPWFHLFSSLKSPYRVQAPLTFLFRGTGGCFLGRKAAGAWSWPFYLHLVLMWRNGGAKPSVPYMSSLLALGQLYILPFNRGITSTWRSWYQL